MSTEIESNFATKQKKCRVNFSHIHLWKYQFTAFSPTSQSVLYSLWTTIVLHWCKCSDFVATGADDADMSVCCAIWASDFLGHVSNLTPISSSFFLVHSCFLCVLLLCRTEPVDWNPFTYMQIAAMFGKGTLGNSSDFMTLLVGTVFSTCIIDIHVALMELMTWLQMTHKKWQPLWHAVR